MMGGKTPETCWAVNKRQDNKPENCCIWLVIYLNWSLCLGWRSRLWLAWRICEKFSMTESVEITNKMQPCNRIYYSKIYWRLNMFRAAYRLSSGAPNCIYSLWFIYSCGDRPLPSLDNGRSPHGYINQRLQIQFGAPDDERYAARNMLSLQ